MFHGTCEIWHKEGETMFRPFKAGDVMTYKYEYPVTEGYGTEDAWRDNNVVHGNEFPVKHETRSLSVGDGVVFTIGFETFFYVVEPFGFRSVSANHFYRGAEA